MSNRKISAKELLADIHADVDDAALLKKNNLTPQGLQDALKKMVDAGLLKQEEVDRRLPRSVRESSAVWTCPTCGMPQMAWMNECLDCGAIFSKGVPPHTKGGGRTVGEIKPAATFSEASEISPKKTSSTARGTSQLIWKGFAIGIALVIGIICFVLWFPST